MGKMKVPVFDGEASTYKKWKKLVTLWQTICDEQDEKKQGVMLIMHMHSKASDIIIDQSDTKVSSILTKLDTIYENENDLMDIFDDFYKFKRVNNQTMKEYIHFFETKAGILKTGGLTIPDLILSYLILEGASLSDNDKRIAKATCTSKTLETSKQVLLRMTDSQVSASSSNHNQSSQIKVKQEPEVNFYGGHRDEEILYNDRRQQRPYQRNQRTQECYGCGDTSHWIRDCPHVLNLRQQFQNNRGSMNRGASNNFRGNNYSYRGANTYRGANNNFRGRNQQTFFTEEEGQYDEQFFEVEQTEANKEQENTSDETNIPIFFQSNVGNEIEEVNLVYETINKAVLDCGASRTVCGSEWFSIYLDSIPEKERNEIIEKPSNTMFKFGVGMLRASKRVIIPVTMCEKKVNLEVDIVDTDIPLLISNPTMKKLGMNVNFQDDKMDMGGRQFNLDTASTGHYTVPLFEPKDVSYINFAMCEILTAESQIDTGSAEKKALKLHRRFAHASSARIIKLLKNADMADKDVFKELEALDTKCDFCLRHKRAAPRPTVSLPLAYEFNELVTMDLKQIDGVWILHCCDYVTRFSAGHVIKNKEAEEVMEKLFICWISVFGPMRKLLTDNGGEFVNDDWKELCSTFNILHKDTASEAAFQNGICERHNDLIGHMTSKMKEDVGCNPQISLMWALHAKNSLISVLGFSPYQLVFGKNPNIPGNSTNNLPAMSSYTTSQTVADHINSLRMAREAYIKAENADRVKRAMRGRVYAGTHQRFFSGDVIYYKKNGYKGWFGPGKVLGQDGAQVLVKSGARTLIKLHPCKMILKETAERQMDSKDEVNENHEEAPVELKKPDDDVTNSDESDSDSEDDDINRSTQPDLTVSPQEQSKESTEEVKEAETEDSTPRISACLDEEAETEDSTPRIRSETEDNTPRTRSRSKPNHLMNKGDVIFIKETEESTWMKCTIIERDGVLGTSWKVTNKDKDRFCVDLDKVTWIRAKDEIPKEADAVMFADQLHLEFALLNFSKPQNSEEEEAIAKEIEQWRKFDVYEEVDRRTFPDQEVIDCRWVINEKKKPEGTVVKARLVVKGFQVL